MAADFDAELMHVEITEVKKLPQTVPLNFFRSSGRSIGYLAQSWIVDHRVDEFKICLTIVDGDI